MTVISQLLAVNPRYRIKVDEALDIPYFKNQASFFKDKSSQRAAFSKLKSVSVEEIKALPMPSKNQDYNYSHAYRNTPTIAGKSPFFSQPQGLPSEQMLTHRNFQNDYQGMGR